MLEIKDLSKLKITKVRPWALYFDYDGEKYLLHGHNEDYEDSITLYKRIPLNDKGKYNLECIEGMRSSSDRIYEFLRPAKFNCYRDINKEYMVKKLTYYGFCCGLYDEYIEDFKTTLNIIQSHLNKLEVDKRELLKYKKDLLDKMLDVTVLHPAVFSG